MAVLVEGPWFEGWFVTEGFLENSTVSALSELVSWVGVLVEVRCLLRLLWRGPGYSAIRLVVRSYLRTITARTAP